MREAGKCGYGPCGQKAVRSADYREGLCFRHSEMLAFWRWIVETGGENKRKSGLVVARGDRVPVRLERVG